MRNQPLRKTLWSFILLNFFNSAIKKQTIKHNKSCISFILFFNFLNVKYIKTHFLGENLSDIFVKSCIVEQNGSLCISAFCFFSSIYTKWSHQLGLWNWKGLSTEHLKSPNGLNVLKLWSCEQSFLLMPASTMAVASNLRVF